MADIRDLLADIIRLQGQQQLQQFGPVAQPPITPPPGIQPLDQVNRAEDPRGPSPVNRVLDLLSRPLYSVAEPARNLVERTLEHNPSNPTGLALASLKEITENATTPVGLNAAVEGFTGRAKTTGSDIVSEIDPSASGLQKGAYGFGLDIAMDPLSYVGAGLVPKIGRGSQKSIQALRGVEDTSDLEAQKLTQDISRRAAGLAEDRSRPSVPQAGTPAPPESAPPRIFLAGPGPTRPPEIQPGTALPVGPLGSARRIGQGSDQPALFTDEILGNIGKQDLPLPTKLPKSVIPLDTNAISFIKQSVTKGVPISQAGLRPLAPVERQIIEQGIQAGKSSRKIERELAEATGIEPKKFFDPTVSKRLAENPKAPDVEIPTMPPQVPTAALAEAGEQIAAPVARSSSTRDLLGDLAEMGTNWRRVVQRELDELPEDADLLTTINKLEDMAAQQRSPVYKNMINKQVRDLRERLAGSTLGADKLQLTKQMAEELRAAKLPPSRTVELGSDLSRELSKMAGAAGAASREAKESKKFMQDLFNPERDVLYSEVAREARSMLRQTMTGKNQPEAINKISNAVYKTLGEGNPKALGRQLPQSRVVEAVMTRFATWWNAKDLRPFARESIDTARNVAAAFAKTITPMVRATKPSQRAEAWRAAQGKISPGTAEQQQLSDWFKYQVEHLLGAHGIDNAESVLARSGTTMTDINKELPVALRFTERKGVDDLGRSFDYSDGKWMHSWKEWDVKDPAEALYQLTRALQLSTRKNAMLDDAAARWGLSTKSGEFNTPTSIDRLKGFYFPAPVAKQLDEVWRRLEKDKFKQGPGIMQFIDKVQRMWKTGVTIYSPSHHIRNLNGDLFLSALDGVVTTTPYKKSAQVMWAFRGRYKDIENVYNIMDPNLKQAALQARPGTAVVTTKAGHNLTAEQVYQAAESQGFLLRAAQLEDLVGESAYGTFGPKFQPLGGRLHGAAAGTSELRDHWVRMAHFIDVLGKSKQRNLRDAIEEAGRRVKKFHPDGSDLTGFEQNVMRRILPFYSWMRKSTPLILEGLAMRPHISLAFPKGMSALQEITGVENNGPGDPFPMDQMFPDWVKEKGVGPIIGPDDPMAGIGRQETWRGETPGYVVVNPTNPVTDQLMELTNPQKALLGGASPWLRIPTELATEHTALGIPISETEGGTAGYLAQQVPPVGIGARVSGMTRPDEPWHPEQLTNWLLTGGLVTGTGPYEMQANFEIREAMNEVARENRRSMR